MAKCKPKYMHILHVSRPEGKRTKRSNTIHYCELQSSRTLTPPQHHVVAFTEKECKEGEVLETCTMEQLEKELPRNWIPERKRQEKFSEFFENPFMQKDDDFLKSPAEAQVHRKYY